MWKIFAREHPAASAPPIFSWRDEIDLINHTVNFVKKRVSENERFWLEVLSGSVFALQQDIQLEMQVNLWSAAKLRREVFAAQEIHLPKEGLPLNQAQMSKVIDTLDGVRTRERDKLEEYSKAHDPASGNMDANALMWGIRSRAATIWLLTVMPSSEGNRSMLQSAVTHIWLILSMAQVDEVIYWAKATSVFRDIEGREFALNEWPSVPWHAQKACS